MGKGVTAEPEGGGGGGEYIKVGKPITATEGRLDCTYNPKTGELNCDMNGETSVLARGSMVAVVYAIAMIAAAGVTGLFVGAGESVTSTTLVAKQYMLFATLSLIVSVIAACTVVGGGVYWFYSGAFYNAILDVTDLTQCAATDWFYYAPGTVGIALGLAVTAVLVLRLTKN